MTYSGRFFIPALLFALAFSALCSTRDALPPGEGSGALSMAGSIVLEEHSSTNPEEFLDQPFAECIRQKFGPRAEGIFQRSSVAHYLSRFYGYTDAFHKARRCDSFLLRYHPDTGDGRANLWYHIALFTFGSPGPVRQIQRLESLEGRETSSLRVMASGDQPGSLTFKAGTEGYRVFFSDKKVLYFFFGSDSPLELVEDPGLLAAALALKECLLPGDR